MSFFNPISFLLFVSIHSLNLFQLDSQLAKDLSGTYAVVTTKEALHTGQCPDTFDIELIAGKQPDRFFMKNKVKYEGFKVTKPRLLPIDGQTRTLSSGQVVKGEVTKPNAIEVEVFSQNDPKETLVETFEFNTDGSLLYSTDHKASKSRKLAFFNALCPQTRYKKM